MFSLSEHQERAVRSNADLIVMPSLAGTGKSTTLCEAAKFRPFQKTLYITYTKASKENSEGKFPDNVTVLNHHALAYRYLWMDFQDKLTQSHNPYFLRKLFKDSQFNNMTIATSYKLINEALTAIDVFCASADTKITNRHVKYVRDSDLNEQRLYVKDITKMASLLWSLMIDPGQKKIRLSLDGMLKLFQLRAIPLPYERILYDETQDANPAMLSCVLQQKHAQKILVGDSHQQIYGYRYAVDAIATLSDQADEIIPLTQSYRCAPHITAFANTLLRKYKNETLQLKPATWLTGGFNVIGRPHTVICRTNAGVLKEAVNLANNGIRVELLNGIKHYDIVRLAELHNLKNRDENVLRGVYADLSSFNDVKEMSRIINDRGTIQLCKLIEENEDIMQSLGMIAAQAGSDAPVEVIATTGHVAKGLEFDAVRLGNDFPILNADLKDEEKNLIYVGMTRAREHLQLPHRIRNSLLD